MVSRPEVRIGLLWHSASSGNLGVGALTVANMAIVREVAEGLGLTPRFTILGMRDGVATYLRPEDAEVVIIDTRALVDPRRVWARIRRQHCILDIGGGDSFTDIYGAKRFAFLWLTKLMAILSRRPLMLSPQTIGPFTKQPQSALAAFALRHADIVMVRDEPSLAAAREMAPAARLKLTCDVAFALPFRAPSAERGGTAPRVGVNVSGLLFNEAAAGRNRFGLEIRYDTLMRRLLAELSSRDLQVELITHVNDPGNTDDDGAVADLLAAEFPRARRVDAFPGPVEAKSYISGLDFLISSRMHACIAAYSSGVPVVPVAYSRKFRGVFGLLGYPALVDVVGMTDDTALAFILDALARRAELAASARTGMTKVADFLAAYKTEIARVLGNLPTEGTSRQSR